MKAVKAFVHGDFIVGFGLHNGVPCLHVPILEDGANLTVQGARDLRDWLTAAIGDAPAATDERPVMPLDTKVWEPTFGPISGNGPTMAQAPGRPWWLVEVVAFNGGVSALWARRREGGK